MTSPNPIRRLQATPVTTSEPVEQTLVDRYLGYTSGAAQVRYTGIPARHPLHDVRLLLADAAELAERPAMLNPGGPALWHVLWIRDDAAASVTITSPAQHDTWPIAPGDSVFVPAGARLTTSGGQLALGIAVSGSEASRVAGPPTHGVDRFFGHNRQTTSFLFGGLRVSRWKLTQPLALAEVHPDGCLVVVLAGSPVLRTAAVIDQLRQGQAMLLDAGSAPIITPGGLAYLLVIERMNEADAIAGLRSADISPAAIRQIMPVD